MKPWHPLPIDKIKDEILETFSKYSNLILKASPGSGKTTRVPLFLLDKIGPNKKIYILEPRRIAAKLAAFQVAKELGEKVGLRVGYIFRFERSVSDKTQILFLTEGTFLKILSKNKNLNDVSLIILDEFHERHLSTDAALSFILKLQKENRTDLKIMIMSATIESRELELFLNPQKTKVLELELSRFNLTTHYLPNVTSVVQADLVKKVRNSLEEIIDKKLLGDILVFLPGMKEIRETKLLLSNLCSANEIDCYVLHGDLDPKDQELVLSLTNKRKIILSTNIAESSVTISGIRIVIDSGLQKESSFNFFSGLPEIKTTKISKASAIQRSGRANREAEGICFRLYAELDFHQRPDFIRPEIEKSDLSELALMSSDFFDIPLALLEWLQPPHLNAIKNADELLFSINAVDDQKKITPIGKKILSYPLHPRLARVLVEAETTNKDKFQEVLNYLMILLNEKNKERFLKQFNNITFLNNSSLANKSLEEIFLTGFPDRICRSRGIKFYDVITANGENLKIDKLISSEFDPAHNLWMILDLNHKGEVTKIVPIEEEWLYNLIPFPISEETTYQWDDKKNIVLKVQETRIGKIILDNTNCIPSESNTEIKKLLILKGKEFIETLKNSQNFERLLTMNRILNSIDLDSFAEITINDFFVDQIHFDEVDKKRLADYFFLMLKNAIDQEGVYNLDFDFPLSMQLSDKRSVAIIYDRSIDPWIETYIQDFYGLTNTPQIAKGKIPLTLKLLGPHKRALQVTQDLPSFWNKTYPLMLKELTREYPRHYWPLNPSTAKPFLLKRHLLG